MPSHARWFLALCVAGAVLASAGGESAETRVGVAGPVEPNASAVSPGGGTQAMAPGQDVAVKEKIMTDDGGQAEILFLDRSSLRIGPNSEMEIDEFAYSPEDGTGKLDASATKGLFRFTGGALSKHEDQLILRTPTSILGVRGGIVLVEIGDDGKTSASFLYGDALTVTSRDGNSVRITTPGNFSVVPANGTAPSPPRPVNVAELEAKLALLHTDPAILDQLPGDTQTFSHDVLSGATTAKGLPPRPHIPSSSSTR
jgi:hypothetical protein